MVAKSVGLLCISFLVFAFGNAAGAVSPPQIDHFVVLMLENRAFDHMCGWLKRENPDIDGLTGHEFNEDHQGNKYYVNDKCPYVNPFGPDHDFPDVTQQIMGERDLWLNPAPMSGFIKQPLDKNSTNQSIVGNVMTGFSPERVPAISTLAQQFALFDKYFVSFPGETIMNRLFFNMGSSGNTTVNPGGEDFLLGFPGRTLYDLFDEQNITWKAYYEDVSDLLYMRNTRNLTNLLNNYVPYNLSFAADAKEGKLPQFSWVSPRYFPDFGNQARDQHPDHDVIEGERLIAEVYEALRSSPKWNQTVLLVTYDEHGGFYDHVPPADPVPNPFPGSNATDGFNFTRNGMRVCTILVSPLVPKGHVEHGAPAGGVYEATSVFNTLQRLWGFPNVPLTARQAWAAPYDHLLSLETPRTDCPVKLPIPPAHNEERFHSILREQQARKPNGLQHELYEVVENLHGRNGKDYGRFLSQLEMGVYVTEQHRLYFEKVKKGM